MTLVVKRTLALRMLIILSPLLSVWLGCEDRPRARDDLEASRQRDPRGASCEELESEQIFERRVSPLASEGATPTCARCHLPGVDFRPFVRSDECSTLACMEEESLVNLQTPEESKILSWIARGHEALNRSLSEDSLAQAEYDAFASWITYQAQCHAQVCVDSELLENPCGKLILPPSSGGVMSSTPDDQIAQDATPSDSTVDQGIRLDSGSDLSDLGEPDMIIEVDRDPPEPCSEEDLRYQFYREVWPLHGRCYHCHSDHYSAASNQSPQPTPWMSDNREEPGSDITVSRLIASDYLNLTEPMQSLILLKPLSIEAGGELHGGGTKMRDAEDIMYLPLLAWIERVATCRLDRPAE